MAVAAGLMFAFPVLAAMAQGYPNRPIRLIVPFAPGGGTDIIARAMAQGVADSLGQQVVVDNRPGGGTLIGAELAARATPDGHTLLICTNGTVSINPSLYKKLPYDPIRDFAPVSLVGIGPNVLVVHPSVAAKSVGELITLARQQPGKLSYASSGAGGAPHLAGEMLKSMAGVNIVHVPYKGAGPASTAVLAGEVGVMFAGLGPALPHIKSGRLRALAVASAQRSAVLPAVPAIAETLKDFEASSWFGVFAPAATPASVIGQLHAAIEKTMARTDVRQRLTLLGYEAQTNTPGSSHGRSRPTWSAGRR